ncbi:hypothetical protein PR048_019844 [Dryococelus australis]|uniref:Uncharacterized protein n=1 Tax=Dryococelus australis TaxID=614101 RepID=A0ABQ9H4M6_9NEOP|nr:hypothetical protein PR048_019844 [Dryococelus australis]
MQGRGKREIPEDTRRPAASSVTRPRIEPGSSWWEASSLTAQLTRPLKRAETTVNMLYTRVCLTGRVAPRLLLQVQKKRRIVARTQCRNIKNECPQPSCDEPVLYPGRCCKTCPDDLDMFDTSWRMLAQSSPSTVTADNQCTVDIDKFVHKAVESSLQTGWCPNSKCLVGVGGKGSQDIAYVTLIPEVRAWHVPTMECLGGRNESTPRKLTTSNARPVLLNIKSAGLQIQIARRPLTLTNQVRFPAGSLPDFRMWESCRTMPLVGGFYRGSPPPLITLRPFIPALLHTQHSPLQLDHALYDSEPIADLQGNKKLIPYCQAWAAASEQPSEDRLYKGLWACVLLSPESHLRFLTLDAQLYSPLTELTRFPVIPADSSPLARDSTREGERRVSTSTPGGQRLPNARRLTRVLGRRHRRGRMNHGARTGGRLLDVYVYWTLATFNTPARHQSSSPRQFVDCTAPHDEGPAVSQRLAADPRIPPHNEDQHSSLPPHFPGINRLNAVRDKVSTFEVNFRKKSLPPPTYILTGTLNDMRPVMLVTIDGKFHL